MGIPLIYKAFGAIRVHDGDFWKGGKGVWVRYHNIPRKALFTPTGTQDGPDWRYLGLRRVTFVNFGDGSCKTIDDNWKQAGHLNLGNHWSGKTVFFEAHIPQAKSVAAEKSKSGVIQEKSSDGEAVDRVLVEACCGKKSCLSTPTSTNKGCKCVRITEEEDFTTDQGLETGLQPIRGATPGTMLTFFSLSCTGGSVWQRLNYTRPGSTRPSSTSCGPKLKSLRGKPLR